MLNFFINPASKHAYLRTLKRANFMIWSTFGDEELVEGIKIRNFEICLIAKIAANSGQQLGPAINFYS